MLGGSVLLAVRENLPDCSLFVWARREDALQGIASRGLADHASSCADEMAREADLVILALPIQHMPGIVQRVKKFAPGALVTDVGSTKGSVIDELAGPVADRGGLFLGSHPMAGSEKTGIEHASSDLFLGATIVVTPVSVRPDSPEVIALQEFWAALGGNIVLMDPKRHDEVAAAVSHLPHMLAAALVKSTLSDRGPEFGQLTASGFRDSTRIAGGDPDMWTEILIDNRAAVRCELDRYTAELDNWKQALDELDNEALRGFLSTARNLRRETIRENTDG